MVDFGFGLVPSSRINLDTFDKDKYEELVSVEPDVRICMACGTCTAVCTAGKLIHTSLREAIEVFSTPSLTKPWRISRLANYVGNVPWSAHVA